MICTNRVVTLDRNKSRVVGPGRMGGGVYLEPTSDPKVASSRTGDNCGILGNPFPKPFRVSSLINRRMSSHHAAPWSPPFTERDSSNKPFRRRHIDKCSTFPFLKNNGFVSALNRFLPRPLVWCSTIHVIYSPSQ
jgi:hypothetical protein